MHRRRMHIFFKGITPVISVILLLLITIAIVGFAMLFMQRSVASTAEESEQQLAKQTSSLGENFEIININGNEVTVRNKGTAELKNLAFYVDGNPVTIKDSTTGSAIPKDGIGTFSLDAAQLAQYPGKKLKVSSSGLTKEENADFYAKNTVAYYTFDGTDGRTIKDESGNGNDGIFKGEETKWNDGTINGATVANGKFGKGMGFDGNDYVSVPDLNSLGITDEITITAWVYPTHPTPPSNQRLVGDSAQYNLRLTNSGTGIQFWFLDPAYRQWSVSDVITSKTWNFMAAVNNGNRVKLYVNGVEVLDQANTWTPQSSSNSLRIGDTSAANEIFNGLIDEVRIYNKALSPQEISEDMNSAYPIYRPVASYSFEKIVDNKAWDTHNVVKGKYGAAISFDGTDDYITANGAGLSVTNAITVEAWFKPAATQKTTASRNQVVCKTGPNPYYYYCLEIRNADKKIYGEVMVSGSVKSVYSDSAYAADVWQHAAGTYDGNTLRLAASGIRQASTQSVTGTISTSSQPLRIGAWGINGGIHDENFNGAIDEVRILNTAIG